MDTPYGKNLPIFPTFYNRPTEDHLERVIERLIDRADKAFLQGLATQAQYDGWYTAMSHWARRVS
jgi:hypothetical protein